MAPGALAPALGGEALRAIFRLLRRRQVLVLRRAEHPEAGRRDVGAAGEVAARGDADDGARATPGGAAARLGERAALEVGDGVALEDARQLDDEALDQRPHLVLDAAGLARHIRLLKFHLYRDSKAKINLPIEFDSTRSAGVRDR